MANRVTGAEVLEIIKSSLSSTQLDPMINAAEMLVNAKCIGFYTDAELKEIERWLSAHFVAIRDPGASLVSKSVGNASESYGVGHNLARSVGVATTPYGQQALILDYLGKLASVGKSPTKVRTFGTSNADFPES